MRSLPAIGGDGGGVGVETFRDFFGDFFGSMMIGGGEVGRLDLMTIETLMISREESVDLLFGVGEGIGSVG